MLSSEIAVSVRGLSKAYTISHDQEKHVTLAETVLARLKNPLQRAKTETFWALKDINFEIKKGEVVGIIGRNGAGKSTLLKVLSRVTEPTAGEIDVYGRVGSLLEVGTGFHPELTGRENIFLNGAILGMNKTEIARQFDNIVEFAGVEKFLDTPVKRYSSGMYVRLAFAVAAHLNPEILIVDEVLAVGDAQFQKKCLGKMKDVANSGRTVFFVSHSIASMLKLCDKLILMHKGQIQLIGEPNEVAAEYMRQGREVNGLRVWDDSAAPGDHIAKLKSVRCTDDSGEVQTHFDIRQEIKIQVEYRSLSASDFLKRTVAIHIVNADNLILFASNDFNDLEWRHSARSVETVVSTCTIPGNFLAEGRFYILAAVVSYNPDAVHALVEEAICFDVYDPTHGDGVRGEATSPWPGVLRPMLEWKVEHTTGALRQLQS